MSSKLEADYNRVFSILKKIIELDSLYAIADFEKALYNFQLENSIL